MWEHHPIIFYAAFLFYSRAKVREAEEQKQSVVQQVWVRYSETRGRLFKAGLTLG